ncbi:MAG: MltA domain-containing protein [Rhodovibrionaceae bacterium]
MRPLLATLRSHPKALWIGIAALLLLGAAVAACEMVSAPPPEPPARQAELLLTPARFADLPGWRDDAVSAALPALQQSCARFERLPDEREVGPGALAGTAADWRAPCQALEMVLPGNDSALRGYLESWFRPYLASNGGETQGLFTGYYETELRGSMTRGGPYQTPLYRAPEDLVKVDPAAMPADWPAEVAAARQGEGGLQPYPVRAEIEEGALAGRNLELIWIDDPVDVFFLHVQGSGRVTLPDGSAVRVGFAGSNGHPFYAIGRALIDEGVLTRENVTAQAVRDWLRAHPEDGKALMRRNERYIFFRLIEGAGPIGAAGVPLTAGRSLAVDPAFLAYGLPLWLDTTWPGTDDPLRRLMVAQDTGSAIKGPVRGDFYWGSGEPALEQAGRMKQPGRYFLLLPKSVAERRDRTS